MVVNYKLPDGMIAALASDLQWKVDVKMERNLHLFLVVCHIYLIQVSNMFLCKYPVKRDSIPGIWKYCLGSAMNLS